MLRSWMLQYSPDRPGRDRSEHMELVYTGAAERGVQGVQLHLKILWVCKTPILHTLLPCDLKQTPTSSKDNLGCIYFDMFQC